MKMECRPERGAIFDGDIRYLLIRPDVLMGVAHHMPAGSRREFLTALEESAFANAQASFVTYKERRQFGYDDFLASTCEVAGRLGWGDWSLTEEADGVRNIRVSHSPFAAGYGPSPHAVCAPIKGVLRAAALVGYGDNVNVEETECAAQGRTHCCFRIMSVK